MRSTWVRPMMVAFLATVLLSGLGGIPCQGDPLTEQKAKAETAVAKAKDDVSQATDALSEARQRVTAATQKAQKAQEALDLAAQKYTLAQQVSQEKTALWEEAGRVLSQAQAQEAAGEAKLEAMRSQVADYARAIYQDNMPMVSVAALMSATNTAELANRVQWTDTILATRQIDLDQLQAIQAELHEARLQSEEAQALAEEAKNIADEHRQSADDARHEAEKAHTHLLAALDEQVAAEQAAASALISRQNALTKKEAELKGINSQIASQNKTTNSGSSSGTTGSTSNSGSSGNTTAKPPAQPPPPSASKAQKVVDFAMSKVGGPYVWGGEGPKGYDCSGLTKMAYAQVGINLPHNARTQYSYGKAVSKNNLQPGDLVFYYSGPTHVGIYVGNGKVVHARNEALGIQMTGVDASPYLGARRLL
ncbi:MAG: NlpC/P60 family protein [Propionibacteriaceae bacterium]|nr:NlpC/P60 family protein [Propionibacteriaceae bacterium]